jgi:glucokinase
MEVTWSTALDRYDEYLLGGDIGGSNTNISIVGRRAQSYKILVKLRFDSSGVEYFPDVIRKTLHIVAEKSPGILPTRGCISAAGPIDGNRCRPTNLTWEIDGGALSEEFSIPFKVMNDFQAICYGVPLLDTSDPDSILPIPHNDGSHPDPSGGSRAVAGAGTGLGVGFLTEVDGTLISLPSEGGHSGFAPFDAQSEALHQYIAKRYDTAPGTELFLSGRGMAEIFNFFRDVKGMPLTNALKEIDRAEDKQKPPLITRHTPTDPGCRDIMKLFIRIYGHFAARVSLFFLPRAGMYLAGGIVVRHAALFLEDNNFASAFENNYNPVMRKVLKSIPLYIVNDYSVSLLGAAHAAADSADGSIGSRE